MNQLYDRQFFERSVSKERPQFDFQNASNQF